MNILSPEEIVAKVWGMALASVTPDADPEVSQIIRTLTLKWARDEIKAQRAHTLKRFWDALKQSRKGEPLDLSPEEFELFESIGNTAVAKAHRPSQKEDRPDREKIEQILMGYKDSELFLDEARDQISALFDKKENENDSSAG